MVHHDHSNGNRWLRLLGWLLPIGSLAAIFWGGASVFNGARVGFASAASVTLVGLVFATAYLVVAVSLSRKRARSRTVLSVTIAVLLMAGAGGATLLAVTMSALSDAFAPSLSSVLQDQAENARVPASAFLETGSKSGDLSGADWNDPAGGKVSVALSWVRNAEGVLVTASPTGPVPKGQDGTPQRQLFVGVDVLAFPLDYFTVEAGQPFVSIFKDWLLMFNRMVDESASPIIDFAKGDGGRLPSVKEADALLEKASKRFKFDYKDGGEGDEPAKVEFVIEAYTYEKKKDGIFEIRYAWSCDYKESDSSASSGDAPVTGVISIDFTASGMMVMERKNGELQHPLTEVLDAYETPTSRATNAPSSSSTEGK